MRLFKLLFLIATFLMTSLSYAGLDPATQRAFQSKNISGIGKVYQVATMEGSIYIATDTPT